MVTSAFQVFCTLRLDSGGTKDISPNRTSKSSQKLLPLDVLTVYRYEGFFPFMKLPIELRHRILDYFVPTNSKIRSELLSFAVSPVIPLEEDEDFKKLPLSINSQLPAYHLTADTDLRATHMVMSIANTSKQMRLEFSTRFWSRTEMRIRLDCVDLKLALQFLKERPAIVQGIKRIVFIWEDTRELKDRSARDLRRACKDFADFLAKKEFHVSELVVNIDTCEWLVRVMEEGLKYFGVTNLIKKIETDSFKVILDVIHFERRFEDDRYMELLQKYRPRLEEALLPNNLRKARIDLSV